MVPALHLSYRRLIYELQSLPAAFTPSILFSFLWYSHCKFLFLPNMSIYLLKPIILVHNTLILKLLFSKFSRTLDIAHH